MPSSAAADVGCACVPVWVQLLGYVVHKVTGQGIDVFYHERIFKPLQMFDTSESISQRQPGHAGVR